MNELQKHILEVFKVFDQLCKNNDLRYFAIGGTAIGAIRHKGFIPWDDDLDVAMPDADYQRLLEIAADELPEGFEIISQQNNSLFQNVFARVYDANTMCVLRDYRMIKETYHGVFIDVMPMSGVPDDIKERDKWFRKLFFDIRVFRRMLVPYSACRTIRNKGMWVLSRLMGVRHNASYYLNEYKKLVKEHPFDSSEMIGYTWSAAYGTLCFPREWFRDYQYLPFEDTYIRCPIDIDKYLTEQFGDYMKPPENASDRTSRHEPFVDLDHSYKDYQQGVRKI